MICVISISLYYISLKIKYFKPLTAIEVKQLAELRRIKSIQNHYPLFSA